LQLSSLVLIAILPMWPLICCLFWVLVVLLVRILFWEVTSAVGLMKLLMIWLRVGCEGKVIGMHAKSVYLVYW